MAPWQLQATPLDTLSVLPWLCLAALAYPLGRVIYSLYFHPISRFPGPKLAASTNLVNLYWSSSGRLHYVLKELHDQYGDVARIGPDMLVYRSTQAWKDIYGHRKHGTASLFKDPKFYILGPSGPSIISANEADHSRERRLLSHAFSEKALREQETLIQTYVDLLVERLDGEIAAARETVDMVRWYNFTTFDIIGDLAFGEPFYCLRESRYHPWVSMIFQGVKGGALLRPFKFYTVFAPLAKLLIPPKVLKARNENFQLSTEKVHRRLKTKIDRRDFMTYILRHNDERSMTTKEIEANAAVLILAGSETTATLLSGFTFYMLTYPAVHQKLVDEIRGTFQSADEINFLAVSRLPYLDAALEESLRMYPPIPAILPRVVPKGGAMIDGEFIPEGVSVSGAQLSTFRAKSHFMEPDTFIPERWLDTRDARFESDNRAALQPFSLGPRNCLGKNLAYAEMRLIAAKVLWHFDMSLDASSQGWDTQKSYIIWEKKPLMVKLSHALGRQQSGGRMQNGTA